MLIEMLRNHPSFQDLPLDQQEVYARLAVAMQEDDDTLYCSPDELVERTQIGNRHQWRQFLAMEPVRNYISARISQLTQIAQRRAFLSLQKEAAAGNVQAIKEINELSGIMEQKDNNKVIVLMQIQRPKLIQEVQEEAGK